MHDIHDMWVLRKLGIIADEFRIGDQIYVGKYTATCQDVTAEGAVFLMDQYLDEPMWMNMERSSTGGYAASSLRRWLNSEEILRIFRDWRDWMVPLFNDDLLRIPTVGEMFGSDWCRPTVELDGFNQWELMKTRKYRVAYRDNGIEYGWLMNRPVWSETDFCAINDWGDIIRQSARRQLGVRPVFLIKCSHGDKA